MCTVLERMWYLTAQRKSGCTVLERIWDLAEDDSPLTNSSFECQSTSCFFHTTSITISGMYQLSCQTCFSVPSTQYGVKRSLFFTGPTDHWFFPPFLSFHKATPNTVFSPSVLKRRRLEKVKGQTRQNLDSTLEISATMLKTETSETWDQREFLHAHEAHSN